MRPLIFWSPFLFLATAPLGFAMGGAWGGVGAFLTLAATPLALCGFDGALGFDRSPPRREGRLVHRLLPWLYIGLQLGVTIWAAWAIAGSGVTAVRAVGLTLSVGVTAGVFGFLAAHEMVHSRFAAERSLGLTMLASVGYMHFRIAHIHGHHRRAATFEDPATARRGESAYQFVVRSVVGQFREAWAFEAARTRRRGRSGLGAVNRMWLYLGLEALIVIAAAAFSVRSAAFWCGQAALAILLLELFNYIAHYGLARGVDADGALERLDPVHSWNSSRRMNNWSLFNMGRHSDHHRQPMGAYQGLEWVEGAPELPTGYAGSIFLALIPPLWRGVMDPRVDRWMGAPMARAGESDGVGGRPDFPMQPLDRHQPVGGMILVADPGLALGQGDHAIGG